MKSAKLAFIPPNKGAIPTSKDTVAVLGMAKKGPIERYSATKYTIAKTGEILREISSI